MARCVVEATVRASAPRQAVWDVLADARSWTERGRRRVESLEPPGRFGYTLLSGLPVRDYHAVVTLTEAGPGATNIHWESRFDGRWGVLDAPIKALVATTLRDVSAKVAAEAERRSA